MRHSWSDLAARTAAIVPPLNLNETLKVGDLVFIQIGFLPFRRVAEDTGTWTNHVGIVIDSLGEPTIAESTIPISKGTSFSRFVGRSERRRVAVRRLPEQPNEDRIRLAATKRLGVLYDTGFNLHSRKQFCSRYVREVLHEAADVEVGEIETLRSLFAASPHAHISFWRLWYFLNIPWERRTGTPVSVYRDERLETVFDGYL